MTRTRTQWILFLVGGIFVAIVGISFWKWDHLAFWFDRQSVQSHIEELGYGSGYTVPNIDEIPIVEVEAIGELVRPMSCRVDDLEVVFEGGRFQSTDTTGAFKDNHNVLYFQSSSAQGATTLSGDDERVIGSTRAAANLEPYFRKADPFDILKAIYQAREEDIAREPNPLERYVPLYLWTMKLGLVVNREVADGVIEVTTDGTRMLVAGKMDTGNIYAEIYSTAQEKFVSLTLRTNGAMNQKHVMKLLRSVQVRSSKR